MRGPFSALRRLVAFGAGGATLAGIAWSSYLVVITVAARRARRHGRDRTTTAELPATRFRVLVPAHNEERLIGETMRYLAALDYPGDMVEVHVVADNCTDRTAAIVAEHGFDAHERHDLTQPGKGPALGWLLTQLPERTDPDSAFVLIDADTLVAPDLLRVFDSHLGGGTPVVQGHYAVRDADAGGNVGFRAAALAVRHYVRPLGRVELGGSSGLYGNGMAFREDIARANPWTDHLVEDIEMGLRLLLDGGTVGYAADAVVEAEMPESLADSTTQNQRWEAGRLQVAGTFGPRLVTAARRGDHGRRWPYVDALLDLTLPPITTLVGASAGATMLLRIAGRGRLAALGAMAGVVAVFVQLGHVLVSLRMVGAPPAVYRSLLLAPVHMVWKVLMLIRLALRRGPEDWIRTTRNEEGRAVMMLDSVPILGIPIHVVTFDGALDVVDRFVEEGRRSGRAHQIATVNTDFVVHAVQDPELHTILANADLAFADGMPLVWASRALGWALPERVAGADLVPAIVARAAASGQRVMFFGGAADTAATAAELMRTTHPGVIVDSTTAMVDADGTTPQDVIDHISAFSPDILCVGLGNPKQERWISRYSAALEVPVSIGVGATFEFMTGHARRAPVWMQRTGTEWLHRMVRDPKRLVRRYATDFLVFAPRVCAQIVRTSVPRRPRRAPEPTTFGDTLAIRLVDGLRSEDLLSAQADRSTVVIDMGNITGIHRATATSLSSLTTRSRAHADRVCLVASSTATRRSLRRLRLDSLFDHATSPSDVSVARPSPRIPPATEPAP